MKAIKKYSLIILFFVGISSLSAQQHKFKRYIFPIVPEFKQSGFYLAPGFTYMIPGSDSKDTLSYNDQKYPYVANPKGTLRFMLQLGYYRTFKRPFFWDFLEAGLSYKILRGEEDYDGNFANLPDPSERNSIYEDQFAGVFFRATKVSQLSDYLFITNSIGVNGDYLFEETRQINEFVNMPNAGPESPLLQAHYQLGFGIKVSKKILVIPTLETPILNLLPFDDGKSTLSYFHSRYRPVLLTIKIMFLRPDPLNCNAPMFEGPQPKM